MEIRQAPNGGLLRVQTEGGLQYGMFPRSNSSKSIGLARKLVGQSKTGSIGASFAVTPEGVTVVAIQDVPGFPFAKGPCVGMTDTAFDRFLDKGAKRKTQHTFNDWEKDVAKQIGLGKSPFAVFNILTASQRERYKAFKDEVIAKLPE